MLVPPFVVFACPCSVWNRDHRTDSEKAASLRSDLAEGENGRKEKQQSFVRIAHATKRIGQDLDETSGV